MEKYKVTYQGIEVEIERLPNGKFKKPSLGQFTKQGLACTWLDEARIPFEAEKVGGGANMSKDDSACFGEYGHYERGDGFVQTTHGRFPANLLVSDDAVDDGRDRPSGGRAGVVRRNCSNWNVYGEYADYEVDIARSTGGFSRYFSLDSWWQVKLSELPESVRRTFPFLVVPKAGKKEKNLGCEGLPDNEPYNMADTPRGWALEYPDGKPRPRLPTKNIHPTVKPLKLMSYLITLGSRPGDLILDPFAGTCTTAMAAKMLGRDYLMVEIDEQWCRIGRRRVEAVQEKLL